MVSFYFTTGSIPLAQSIQDPFPRIMDTIYSIFCKTLCTQMLRANNCRGSTRVPVHHLSAKPLITETHYAHLYQSVFPVYLLLEFASS